MKLIFLMNLKKKEDVKKKKILLKDLKILTKMNLKVICI